MGTHKEWNKDAVINIITGSRISRVLIDDIEAVEQDGRKLHIMTGTEDYACYAAIDSVSNALLDTGYFYQPMKKLIINFEKVTEIQDNEIHFLSGASLIMGRNKVAELKKDFKEYLMDYPSTIIGGGLCCVSESENNY